MCSTLFTLAIGKGIREFSFLSTDGFPSPGEGDKGTNPPWPAQCMKQTQRIRKQPLFSRAKREVCTRAYSAGHALYSLATQPNAGLWLATCKLAWPKKNPWLKNLFSMTREYPLIIQIFLFPVFHVGGKVDWKNFTCFCSQWSSED